MTQFANFNRIRAIYIILGLISVMAFSLIFFGRGMEDQAWAVILLIVGALIRDAAGVQSAATTERIADASLKTAQTAERIAKATGPQEDHGPA